MVAGTGTYNIWGETAPRLIVDPASESCGHHKLRLGKYVSLSWHIKVYLCADHRLDSVTTYPFPSFRPEVEELHATQLRSKGDVSVGNDVWVATDVSVLSGVTVGDGAVLAAGAMVTKDVPPYAIVAGNPARVVKKRFDDETIERLLAIRWWDWPRRELELHLPRIFGGDVAVAEWARGIAEAQAGGQTGSAGAGPDL